MAEKLCNLKMSGGGGNNIEFLMTPSTGIWDGSREWSSTPESWTNNFNSKALVTGYITSNPTSNPWWKIEVNGVTKFQMPSGTAAATWSSFAFVVEPNDIVTFSGNTFMNKYCHAIGME